MKKQFFNLIAILISSFALISMISSNSIFQDPWEVPAKYVKMENTFAKATDADNIGRALYSKHCKSCHGAKGKGDGSKAESIDTPMPDFTNSSFGKQTDGSLYYKTFIGRKDMPSFEKKITDEEERWLVVNYIKTLVN